MNHGSDPTFILYMTELQKNHSLVFNTNSLAGMIASVHWSLTFVDAQTKCQCESDQDTQFVCDKVHTEAHDNARRDSCAMIEAEHFPQMNFPYVLVQPCHLQKLCQQYRH